MKQISKLCLFIICVHLTVQAFAQAELDSAITYTKERLGRIPEVGNVKVKNQVATSTFSRSLPVLRDTLHKALKEEVWFQQTVDFYRGFSGINLPVPLSPGGIELFDNGLNYTLTQPEITIKKIYIRGQEPICDIDHLLSDYGEIQLPSDAYVDSLDVYYKYVFCTQANVVTLSLQNPLYQQYEEYIYLNRIEDQEVEMKVNYPAFERIVRIEGRDAKKRRIHPNLEWTRGYISKELVELHFEMLETIRKWKIEDGEEVDEQENYPGYAMTMNFPSQPAEIQIFLSSEIDSIQGELVLSRTLHREEEYKIGVFVTDDVAGIIDIEGNVLIEPSYCSLRYLGGVIFYGRQNEDDRNELFKLDVTRKSLLPVGYKHVPPTSNKDCEPALIEVYDLLEDPDTGKEKLRYGLMDQQGNLVLPIIYDRIGFCLSEDGSVMVAWLDTEDPEYYQYDPETQSITLLGESEVMELFE